MSKSSTKRSQATAAHRALKLGVLIVHRTARLFLLIFISCSILYTVAVSVFLLSTQLKLEFVIGNRIAAPLFANFSSPRSFGLQYADALYIPGNAGKLGAWFVYPPADVQAKQAYLLYLHGQGGSRALNHRVELLDRTSRMGFHVLAVDYRGFADSDGWPTESGMVEDSISAYKWILKKAGHHSIYIWGHSLGASMAIQLSSWLCEKKMPLNGVILDSPFNNFTDAVLNNPLFMPALYLVADVHHYLADVKSSFRNDLWIQNVTVPILMLHGKADMIINVECARKLYLSSLQANVKVKYVEFNETLAHCFLMRADNLPDIVETFRKETS